MGALITTSIRVDKLPKEKFIKGKDGAVYYNFTISISDETRYGNNVALMDSRTQEEREAGKAVDYLGNGKVIWIKDVDVQNGVGKIMLAEKEEKLDIISGTESAHVIEKGDLPF
tara:strand:+ start:1764 stop:2105 length:342 start_codon:yes stop_codon:yes gene_type:complete